MFKSRQGCSSYFLGLKFGQILFFCAAKFSSYFFEIRKISAISLGLTKFQLFWGESSWMLECFEWRTHNTEKYKIIVAFYIYSNLRNNISLLNDTAFIIAQPQRPHVIQVWSITFIHILITYKSYCMLLK